GPALLGEHRDVAGLPPLAWCVTVGVATDVPHDQPGHQEGEDESDQAEQQRQPVMGDEVPPITFEHVSNLRCPQREQLTLPAAGATYAARSGSNLRYPQREQPTLPAAGYRPSGWRTPIGCFAT